MLHPQRPTAATRVAASRAVLFAYAASAGIHAGLVPEHPAAEPRLGVAFLVAVLVLLAAVSIELLGLGCALWLDQPISRLRRRPFLQEVPR